MTDFTIVDVVPQSHSGETHQDAEPSIGVNQADPDQIAVGPAVVQQELVVLAGERRLGEP